MFVQLAIRKQTGHSYSEPFISLMVLNNNYSKPLHVSLVPTCVLFVVCFLSRGLLDPARGGGLISLIKRSGRSDGILTKVFFSSFKQIWECGDEK